MWFDLAIVMALVCLNALLAGTEIALVSLREGQLKGLAEGSRRGEKVVELVRDPNRYLGAVQLGITLAGFLASAAAAVSISEPVADLFGGGRYAQPAAVTLVTVILSLVTLVFGELVPKRLAMQRAERWSLVMVRPLWGFITVTRPIIVFLSALTDLLVSAAGGDPDRHRDDISDDEIVDLVEAHPTLTETQRQIMAGAIEIAGRSLRQVLVPRNRVVTIDATLSVDQARQRLLEAGHSRAPVVRGTLDDPVGQVHLRDLFDDDGIAGERASPLIALPESVSVLEALRQLQAGRCELAAVVDEYGGTAGIITIEDLVEELVGEIYDETDRDLLSARVEEDGSLIIPGSFPMHDLADIGVELPTGSYSTVAGLVLDRLGYVPRIGERLVVSGIEIEVMDMDGRSIVKLRVVPPEGVAADGQSDSSDRGED
ncbi:MAG: HlyC/CorC family transporter [Acidimicrobiales bacterium]|nr:HlyC/CorC family transporter [Acidimicrobiales bacterium]